LLLSSKCVDGSWVRMTVGRSNVPVPMLPEHRQLVAVQEKIDAKFALKKGGDGDGTSAYASLPTCIEADIAYAIKLGHLVKNEEGQVMLPDGSPLRVQFKMDACRLWSKVQQVSVAFVFVNACTNPNSPFDTTEFCLFEGDDHWDSVSTQAKDSLVEINRLIKTAALRYDDTNCVIDVWAGGDLSNQCDMLCVSSCSATAPSPACSAKQEKRTCVASATLSRGRWRKSISYPTQSVEPVRAARCRSSLRKPK
jgi:hypothetical protein